MGVLSSDICLGVGDKFERTLLDGFSDIHSEVLSSGIRFWVGNESKRTVGWLSRHSQKFCLRHPSGWEMNPKELCWVAAQSHSQVLPEQASIWAQAVPVPHVQAVAGQLLDRASLPVWIVPGSGWELALVLTKERPVLR